MCVKVSKLACLGAVAFIIGCTSNQQKTNLDVEKDSAVVEMTEESEIEENEVSSEKQEEVYGIDLGLSVNWADCNVGANSSEECGLLVPYGNVTGTTRFPKPVLENISGTEQDIAVIKMGNGWRMPTEDEMRELIENCSCNIVTVNDVVGVRFSAQNGNSIFLPANGIGYNVYDDRDSIFVRSMKDNKEGNYWCGTGHKGIKRRMQMAREMGINPSGNVPPATLHFSIERNIRDIDNQNPTYCYAVRAVHEK